MICISPPESVYELERESFEKYHQHINLELTIERWGRIRYNASHVDALFDGWVKGRHELRERIKL